MATERGSLRGSRDRLQGKRAKGGDDALDPGTILPGRRPVLELLRAGRGAEYVLVAQGASPSSVLAEIRRKAREAGVPVRVVPRSEIDLAAPETNHQGVVAITARYRYTPLGDLLARPDPCLLFLDGITDPHNVGSLLRSVDCAGFTGAVLPARRSAGVTAAVRRVAAGAAEVVPVARVTNLGRALDEAKAAGLWVLGLEEKAATSLWDHDLAEPPVALVLGAEDRGMSHGVKERCDGLGSIPLGGRIASLNVAVAGGVAMFEVARRKKARGV